MKPILFSASVLLVASLSIIEFTISSQSQTAMPTPGGKKTTASICKASADAVSAATNEASRQINDAKAHADKNTEGDKKAVDGCAKGYVTMEKNHWVLDVPEIKMINKEMSFDVPQMTMKDQHIIFGTPSVECKDVKTGQYPEFTCRDTWIEGFGIKTKGVPECTTTWSDIITRQCLPILTQHDIVMGMPETKIAKTSVIIGIPEVTMKRRDWYFDLPKFHVTEGCIGEQCQKKCNEASAKMTNNYQAVMQPAVSRAKAIVGEAVHASVSCQRGVAVAQRDATLAQIDANIAIIRGTLAQLVALGATKEANDVSTKLNALIATRKQIGDQFNIQLAQYDKVEKTALH